MTRGRAELLRKVVHLGAGGCAVLLRWLPWPLAAALALAALLLNLFVLHRLTGGALLREEERRAGWSRGIVLYPAAVLVLVLVFHDRLDLAAAAWGLLAVGDGMATIAGVVVGGPRLPWNPAKTWSGSASFVLFGTAAATLLQDWVLRSPSWAHSLLGCFVAALAAAAVESLPTGVDDNLSVPLIGGGTLYVASIVDPRLLAGAAESAARAAPRGLAVNLVLASLAYAAGTVGPSGAILGTLLGTALFALAGWQGFAVFLGFFVLGSLATRAGWRRKVRRGVEQERAGRRGARHALANMLGGLLFAFLALAGPDAQGYLLAFVAAFATAAADTVSSEIGQAFGRRTYLVTTLRLVPPGTDGAVSLEGTAAGILASAVLGGIAWGVGLISGPAVPLVVAGALVGTTVESYIGTVLRGGTGVANDFVNFLNTIVGGASALVLGHLVSR